MEALHAFRVPSWPWGLVDLRPAAKWSSFDLLILFNGNYDEKASGIFVTASIMN